MAKIARVKDLPEWFGLEKYQQTEAFGAAEWLTQLRARKYVHDCFVSFTNAGLDLPYMSELLQAAKTELTLLRESPLGDFSDSTWSQVMGDFSEVPYGNPVRGLTLLDLINQYRADHQDYENGLCPESKKNRWSLIQTTSLKVIPEELISTSVGALMETGEPLLVDMRAPDPVLVEAFVDWLKKARTRQPISSSKRERPAYRDWKGYGLLPYLDLRIWLMGTGNRISHHVMAEAVGYCKGGDSFRKTVPKLANDLLFSLAELEAMAAVEATSEKLYS